MNELYPELGIRSFGKGTFHKPPLSGADAGSKRLFRIEPGDLVFSNIFSWEGAVAVASQDDEGRFGSHRFITCDVDRHRAEPVFLCSYLARSAEGLNQLLQASPGGAGRNRTLGLNKLAEIEVPLPSLAEQRAIVAHLDALVDKTRQLTEHLDATEVDADHLLALRFHDAIAHVPYRPMGEVAPLVRREVVIDPEASYPELGIRSFGKGTFHKPALAGIDVGSKRLFRIAAGDLLFSNVFAWEGAIAIAQQVDEGRFGSHRFMSCVVDPRIGLTEFFRYYLMSPLGLEKVREASPGGAGRNRTLGVDKLKAIEVPVPSLATQQAFLALHARAHAIRVRHLAIREASSTLLPATLERLFPV